MIFGVEQIGGRCDDIACGAARIPMHFPGDARDNDNPAREYTQAQAIPATGNGLVPRTQNVEGFRVLAANSAAAIGTVVLAGSFDRGTGSPGYLEASCIQVSGTLLLTRLQTTLFVSNNLFDAGQGVQLSVTGGVDVEDWTTEFSGTYLGLGVNSQLAIGNIFITRQLDATQLVYGSAITAKAGFGESAIPAHFIVEFPTNLLQSQLLSAQVERAALRSSTYTPPTAYMRVAQLHAKADLKGAVDATVTWKQGFDNALFFGGGFIQTAVGVFVTSHEVGAAGPKPGFVEQYSGQLNVLFEKELFCSPHTNRGYCRVGQTLLTFNHTLDERLAQAAHQFCVGFVIDEKTQLPPSLQPATLSDTDFSAVVTPRIIESNASNVVPLNGGQVTDAEQALFLPNPPGKPGQFVLSSIPSVLQAVPVQSLIGLESGQPDLPARVEQKNGFLQYGSDLNNCVRFTGPHRRCTVPTTSDQSIQSISVLIELDAPAIHYGQPRTAIDRQTDLWGIAARLVSDVPFLMQSTRPDGYWMGSNVFCERKQGKTVEARLTARDVPPVTPVLSGGQFGPGYFAAFLEPVPDNFLDGYAFGSNINLIGPPTPGIQPIEIVAGAGVFDIVGAVDVGRLSDLDVNAYKALVLRYLSFNPPLLPFVETVLSTDWRLGLIPNDPDNRYYVYPYDAYADWDSPHPYIGLVYGPGSIWEIEAKETLGFCRIKQQTRTSNRVTAPSLTFDVRFRSDVVATCKNITCDIFTAEKPQPANLYAWEAKELDSQLPGYDEDTAETSAESYIAFEVTLTPEQSDAFMNFEAITVSPPQLPLPVLNESLPISMTLQAVP